MNYRELLASITPRLTSALGDGEGRAAAYVIMDDVAHADKNFIFAYGDRTVLPFVQDKVMAAVSAVEKGTPVQYAVGLARFCGRDFIVTPAVLIPRPETEWLVDAAVRRFGDRQDLRILDIGTGSGCIAVSLAADLPWPQVDAMDISGDALNVARGNARRFNVKVNFIRQDIFTARPLDASYDAVISNPPYVLNSERTAMDARVADREPAQALFVPSDSDPLAIYRAIASYAAVALVPGGWIALEINPLCADDMLKLLNDKGFANPQLERDCFGRYRFVTATKQDD